MQKQYLIIGGSAGIGSHIVKQLSSAAHLVYATQNTTEVSTLPGVEYQPYDVESNTSLEIPTELDGLVYCPGTISLKPFDRFSDEDFQKDWSINFLEQFVQFASLYLP